MNQKPRTGALAGLRKMRRVSWQRLQTHAVDDLLDRFSERQDQNGTKLTDEADSTPVWDWSRVSGRNDEDEDVFPSTL